MGLLDILTKKASSNDGTSTIASPAYGKVVSMTDIPDPVFSTGTLGFCCGIEPSDGKVFAPVDGIISSVAATQHAIGVTGKSGAEILIHVGVDTVEMQGEGFISRVSEGDHVKKGQLLLTMNLDKIHAAGYPTVVITVVANTEDYTELSLTASDHVDLGDELIHIRK